MWRSRPSSERALGSRLTSALLAFLFLPPACAGLAAANPAPRVVYTSPVAGARLVRPASGLIARFDRPLGPAEARDLPAFAVTGQASGAHAGRTVLADDGRALLFRPDAPFANGERVDVTLAGGVLGAGAVRLAFETAPRPAPPLDATARAALEATDGAADPLSAALSRATLPLAPAAALDSIPPDYPPVATTLYGATSPGDLFLSNFSTGGPGAPFLLILHDDGSAVFYRQMRFMCTDFRLHDDGRLAYFDTGTGKYYALDENYAIVDSFACGNGYETDEHELRLLPNGHALLLGIDPEIVDMRQYSSFGDSTATVYGAILQELDADKNVIFEWRSWDHFQITDATHENLNGVVVDYVHPNAIELDTDGNLLLSSRHMDEITKIDRVTGALIWRWGGKNNQFTFVDPEGPFSHQHAIRRIANGHFTLFDNGDYKNPQYSRACEYALDEGNKIATLVWEYRNSPDIYGGAMGYVQRLADGHTLIGWGTGNPDVIELDADGQKVMEAALPTGQSSYRALRESWDPSLAGVGGGAAEGRAALALSPGAPNPSRGATELTLSLAAPGHVTLQLFDLAGRKVLDVMKGEARGPGATRVTLDLTGRPAGVYFARAASEAGVVTRRLVHVE